MAYFPIVGRLDCASSSVEHLGFWEMNGYGIMSMFKSDWERFGGENNSVKHHAIFSRLNLVVVVPVVKRDFTQNKKAKATRTSPNNRFEEQNNSCARAF